MRGKLLRLQAFLKKHHLWVGFLAAFLPLVILLGMQARWLVDLKDSSRSAREAELNNYLEAVTSKIHYYYAKNAERALNLSPSIFTENQPCNAAYYFKKKEVWGYKSLFVYALAGESRGKIWFYDKKKGAMVEDPGDASPHAIWVSCAPFSAMAKKGDKLESVELTVDERLKDHRMILLPITDAESRVVGVAGMVLDDRVLHERVLPNIVDKALPHYFSDDAALNLIVTARDGTGRLVFGPEKAARGKDEASKPFAFAFKDHTLGLRSRHITPAQWASYNFALNISLSALIAAVLLAGILLALRTASREMRLSQMKADFVSNVSHELRTPLASIRVFGEFLRLGRTPNEWKTREYGEYIEAESRRLTGLIDNILDFSRIESGRKTYSFESGDLQEVVEEALKCFRVRLQNSGFEIEYAAPLAPLPAARMDKDAIGQALCNLLENAVKYSADSRRIRVSLERKGAQALLSVQDWGIGISRSEQSRIFDRFHRVGSSLVHDVKGAGLGLSIVNHIVQSHEGQVSVESELGRGSVFVIQLPLEDGGASSREKALEGPRAPELEV
jgi:signal transduction histidine kinase